MTVKQLQADLLAKGADKQETEIHCVVFEVKTGLVMACELPGAMADPIMKIIMKASPLRETFQG